MCRLTLMCLNGYARLTCYPICGSLRLKVKGTSNVYCTAEHDSLKISNGKWYWWSRGFGGYSALDYFIKVNQLAVKANALGFVDTPMLREEARKWHEFQIDIRKRYLLPRRSS